MKKSGHPELRCVIAVKESDSADDNDDEEVPVEQEQYHYIIQ